ncbi:hypothetical protein N7454_008669 [Penicillium verhagenii]|nr:hypothetical protein N7454_008669 [Penicillium verhagenii]
MVFQQSSTPGGGSYTEMAPTSTSIPKNTGKKNAITPKPHPDQRNQASSFLSYDDLAAMPTDKATDMPRSTSDRGQTSDSMSDSLESKSSYLGTSVPGRSAGPRDIKPQGSNSSEYDRFVGDNELDREGIDREMGVHQVRTDLLLWHQRIC